jgi:PD-(D/E)XK nuclease superfamily
MTYSFTQISQYLNCPRRYRYRYLDGWKEKDTRAAMLFGRAFEQAVTAYFRREDPGMVLFLEWAAHKDNSLEYSNGTTWDRMPQQGIQLLERFAQDDRIRIRQPKKNLQIKFTTMPARYLSTSGPADTRTEEPGTTVSPWNTPPDACDLFTLK